MALNESQRLSDDGVLPSLLSQLLPKALDDAGEAPNSPLPGGEEFCSISSRKQDWQMASSPGSVDDGGIFGLPSVIPVRQDVGSARGHHRRPVPPCVPPWQCYAAGNAIRATSSPRMKQVEGNHSDSKPNFSLAPGRSKQREALSLSSSADTNGRDESASALSKTLVLGDSMSSSALRHPSSPPQPQTSHQSFFQRGGPAASTAQATEIVRCGLPTFMNAVTDDEGHRSVIDSNYTSQRSQSDAIDVPYYQKIQADVVRNGLPSMGSGDTDAGSQESQKGKVASPPKKSRHASFTSFWGVRGGNTARQRHRSVNL